MKEKSLKLLNNGKKTKLRETIESAVVKRVYVTFCFAGNISYYMCKNGIPWIHL